MFKKRILKEKSRDKSSSKNMLSPVQVLQEESKKLEEKLNSLRTKLNNEKQKTERFKTSRLNPKKNIKAQL
jgi:hypothetical protein